MNRLVSTKPVKKFSKESFWINANTVKWREK